MCRLIRAELFTFKIAMIRKTDGFESEVYQAAEADGPSAGVPGTQLSGKPLAR